jgi:hypothetical protein
MVGSSNHRPARVSCDGPPSSKMHVGTVRMWCPSYMCHCACGCGLGCGEDVLNLIKNGGPPLIQSNQNAVGVARKAEASR